MNLDMKLIFVLLLLQCIILAYGKNHYNPKQILIRLIYNCNNKRHIGRINSIIKKRWLPKIERQRKHCRISTIFGKSTRLPSMNLVHYQIIIDFLRFSL